MMAETPAVLVPGLDREVRRMKGGLYTLNTALEDAARIHAELQTEACPDCGLCCEHNECDGMCAHMGGCDE